MTRKRKQEKAEGGGILKSARFHGANYSKDFDVLQGCELCVINGLEEKRDLEEKAARLGVSPLHKKFGVWSLGSAFSTLLYG